MINTQRGAWTIARQQDFTGGENRFLTPDFVKENQLILAQNCVMSAEGGLQTRLGKTALNATLGSGALTSVHRFMEEDGTGHLFTQHGTTLYAAAWNGTSTTVTFASTNTDFDTAPLVSVVWKDNLYLTNGTENVQVYNGTTCTDLAGSPPKSEIITVYGGKMWLVDVANPNQVRWSGLETPTSWDALDVLNVRDGDGDKITGLCPLNGGMVVLKQNSAWAMYGTSIDDIQLSTAPLADNKGCIAPRSVVSLGDKGFCVGKDGFYMFDLTGMAKMTTTHDVILASLSDTEKAGAYATYQGSDNRIVVALPDASRTTLNFEMNYGAVTSWTGLNSASLTTASGAGDPQQLLIGDASTGILYLLNNETDDAGSAIDTHIMSPYFDFGSVRDKIFRWFRPDFAPLTSLTGTVNLYYDIDYKNIVGFYTINRAINAVLKWGLSHWGASAWGPIPYTGQDYLQIHNGRGFRASFGIRSPGRIKYTGYVIKYREAGAI